MAIVREHKTCVIDEIKIQSYVLCVELELRSRFQLPIVMDNFRRSIVLASTAISSYSFIDLWILWLSHSMTRHKHNTLCAATWHTTVWWQVSEFYASHAAECTICHHSGSSANRRPDIMLDHENRLHTGFQNRMQLSLRNVFSQISNFYRVTNAMHIESQSERKERTIGDIELRTALATLGGGRSGSIVMTVI